MWEAQEDIARGDQHAGRAIAALQRMVLGEGFTQSSHRGIVLQPLDGDDLGPLAGQRVGDARTRRRAFDQHRTGAADAVLATDMGAGQELVLAQEVGEVEPRLDLRPHRGPVDGEGKGLHGRQACWAARLRATTARLRMYASATTLRSSSCSTAPASNRSERSEPKAPLNREVASANQIGAVSIAPMTARNAPLAGSCRTPPIPCAYSPAFCENL